jgi:hypothetical protein
MSGRHFCATSAAITVVLVFSLWAVAAPPENAGGAEPWIVEEQGFKITLQPEWAETGTPGGAKYRYLDQGGQSQAFFFTYGKNERFGTSALMGKPDPLEAVLESKIKNNFKDHVNYKPVGTQRRKIGGCDAVIHDFTFGKDEYSSAYRACMIAVDDTPSSAPDKKAAPSLYEFDFMVMDPNRFDEFKAIFDQILDSMKFVALLRAK